MPETIELYHINKNLINLEKFNSGYVVTCVGDENCFFIFHQDKEI